MAMTVANFSGAEAEEPRHVVGMRRSWQRQKNLEGKLRDEMAANRIDTSTQESIIRTSARLPCIDFRSHKQRASL
jgi:error-prone DNA polymerase